LLSFILTTSWYAQFEAPPHVSYPATYHDKKVRRCTANIAIFAQYSNRETSRYEDEYNLKNVCHNLALLYIALRYPHLRYSSPINDARRALLWTMAENSAVFTRLSPTETFGSMSRGCRVLRSAYQIDSSSSL
jgi:hypothetical protein